MAVTIRRARGPFHSIQTVRYLSSSFRTLLVDPSSPSANPSISERDVLDELSVLLPIVQKRPLPLPFTENLNRSSSFEGIAGGILSPEERLRGVFLWKVKGRFAVNSALDSTGIDLTVEIFARVLDKWSLGGAEMVAFFDWAVEQPNVSRCVDPYNMMLRSLGRRKFFCFVDDIIFRMKRDGVKPDSNTVEIMIDCLVRARQVAKAVELFRGLEHIVCVQGRDSLNIILKSLCRRSHVRLANSLFNEMKGKFLFDSTTYNLIIGGWAKLGRVDKVETILLAMEDAGLNPDQITFSHLIEALGRAGRNDEAVGVLEKMELRGCPPTVLCYNAVIFNFILLGNIDEGLKYHNHMFEGHCFPNMETYEKLICACIKARRVADALELFNKMLEKGIQPSVGMVSLFIEPLCKFGPPYAAMQIYEKSRKAGCVLSMKAYKNLLMRLSRFGKCGMVLKVWEDMQDVGHKSDKEVYEFIVDGLCNIGHVDKAVLVMEESLRNGFCLGKIVYSKLNNKLLEMDKVESAYRLFLMVKEFRIASNSRRFSRAKGWHF